MKDFGAVRVDYEKIQGKVNRQFDSTTKQIHNQFAKTVRDEMGTFFAKLEGERDRVEGTQLHDVKSAINFLGTMDATRAIMPEWAGRVELFTQAQKALKQGMKTARALKR